MSDEKCCGACGYPIYATKESACDWCRRAADRIEALTKERDQWISHAKAAIWSDSEELKETERRLAKAVDALERAKASIENGGGGGVVDVVWLDDPCPETLCDFIDATLAEIKGENHD